MERRTILVTRATRLEELIRRYNTQGQARFYIEHLGEDFQDYLAEHDRYKQGMDRLYRFLSGEGKVALVDRTLVSQFLFDPDDLVYVLGQDGLVANTMKEIGQE